MRKLYFALSLFLMAALFLMPLNSSAKKASQPFKDVPSDHPFAETISSLKAKSFVNGYGDGTFGPDFSVSRAEFITMIAAATKMKTFGANCFKDVKNEWFAKFVCGAKSKGLIKGYGDGTFKPANNINFAEASAVIAKAYSLNPFKAAGAEPWYKPAIEKLQARSAIPVTVDYVSKKLSRAETGEIIYRLATKTENRPTKTYKSLISPLPSIGSCDELNEKLRAFRYIRYGRNWSPGFTMAIPAALPMKSLGAGATESSDAGPSGGGAASTYSATNVQVEGVDEADIIKNDGEFIYLVKGNTVRILKAYPPVELKEVTKLQFSDSEFTPVEMYVTAEKLVVIGMASRVKIYIFSMSADRQLTEDRNLEFDGWHLSSRRIGNNVYLVVNYEPLLKQPLPRFYDALSKKESDAVSCNQVRFLPEFDNSTMTTVVAIDISNPQTEPKREVIMGAGNEIYASLNNLYVAAMRYTPPEMDRFDIWAPPFDNLKTVIFQFKLSDGSVVFKSRGEVKGKVHNQFSMDEYEDAFRLTTTSGEVWAGNSKNNLFILDKNNLENVLGRIENIAPGETIYSTRFMGKRAYMVTFKKVDPFFVIDVEDPKNPKILGALKIPGFSDYMHPFDENHIIGFGKEAVDMELQPVPAAGTSAKIMMPANFAWYQGMKIALFDVTDVSNPKEMFKEVIGDRGTGSELLHNHKALLFDKSDGLFAFPVTVAEIKEKTGEQSQYGETVFQGAYVYKLDLTNGFQLKGKVTHFDAAPSEANDETWYNEEKTITRIVSIGEYLYTISLGKIKALKREDVAEVSAVKVE